MKIEEWNAIQKDKDTNTQAQEGDICTLIDGVAFLVQRKNDFNNVICIRTEKNKKSLLETFCTFRQWLQDNEIQYIRIEGVGKHTYKILYFLAKICPESANFIKDLQLSENSGRSIYFVKTY